MQPFQYHVDMALCIDATGSMGPVLEQVKTNALRFYSDISAALTEKSKVIAGMRVRVVAFRDFYVDGDRALQSSEFFSLPEQAAQFERFVKELRADGGGDEPESALEALAVAIKSPWTREGQRQRHLIVLWTDASAHPLEKASTDMPSNYPSGMPGNLSELTDLWAGQEINFGAKRLIFYAPDAEPWSVIGATNGGWENAIWYPSRAGHGLDDLTYKEIINAIVNSVG